MTENLPIIGESGSTNAGETAPSPETTLKVESLAKIVSASATENAKPKRTVKPSSARRAGGRPRKGGAPNKATLELMGLEKDPLAPPPGAPAGSALSPSLIDAELAAALDIPPEMLAPFLQLPFDIARMSTGFPGFGLPDDVAKKCAPLFGHVLRQYLPATDSEHAPAMILALTLGSHFGFQYFQFMAAKKEQTQTLAERNASAGSSGAAA